MGSRSKTTNILQFLFENLFQLTKFIHQKLKKTNMFSYEEMAMNIVLAPIRVDFFWSSNIGSLYATRF